MSHASAVRTLLSLVLLHPLVLTGCGGGMTSPSTIQPAPVDLKKKPKPPDPPPPAPKPVVLPKVYSLTILPCAEACQAEAINDAGVAVGWQVVNGQAQAVSWTGRVMQ